jgi:tRNA(adenine34) deaminase
MLPRTQTAADFDRAMMERCIALAIQAVEFGEYPYAAVVCRNGEVVCESINSVREDHDVTHHAEVVALRQALGRLRRASLEDCTIYANTEPCALCS